MDSNDKDVVWPTLESFSKLAPQPDDVSADRRKAPRRDVEDHGVEFVAESTRFTVADLSLDGLGLKLLDPGALLLFAVGTIVTGNLRMEGRSYPFRAKVKHQRVGVVGCQFEDPSPELKAEITKLLDPTFLGSMLKPAVHQSDASHAFLGPGNTAVFFRTSPRDGLQAFIVFVLGFFTAYAKGNGLSTGTIRVLRKPGSQDPIHPSQWHILSIDRDAATEKVTLARRLIEGSHLPSGLVEETTKLLGG